MSDGGLFARSGLIEWIFVLEVVLLATASVIWLVSLPMRKSSPDDSISLFISVFWKVLLRRRVGVAAAVGALTAETARRYEEYKQSGNVEGIKQLLSEANNGQEFDDVAVNAIVAQARAGRTSTPAIEAPTAQSITLAINVIPYSPQNQLVGVKGDVVTIHSVSGPEEGSVNKIVIDIIGTLLDVKPYRINLTKGHYRANKVLQVAGVDAATWAAKTAQWS